MADINVKGLSDLTKFLEQLPVKLEKNVMRGAMRASAKEVLPEVKANIRPVSGKLAAGLKISTRARGGQISASIKATGEHAPVAHLLEYGVKAHLIVGEVGKGVVINGQVFKDAHHPGFTPKPFMRPALDTRAQDAVVAAGNYVKNRLATKEGLDVQDIQIGDE